MVHKTKGLVMRSVRYGDTSLIVSVFTELFGMQSYMVNGVRKAAAKGGLRASMFEPGTMLDLVVYHNGKQGLQRIREAAWMNLERYGGMDVRKQSVLYFMLELLQKCLRQPEPQPELFHFMEDAMSALDAAGPQVAANLPLFFILHLSHFFGFRMHDNLDEDNLHLDLREGVFTPEPPDHADCADVEQSRLIGQFLRALQPEDLEEMPMTREGRRSLLDLCLRYYALHIPDFGKMRSLPVLQELLD
jgi:DNA repair protein RecO (recombination protein O)